MKPIYKYNTTLSVPGTRPGSKENLEFNKAWGFKDGSCNDFIDGQYVAREPYPEGFEEAHRALYRAYRVSVEVSVYKDGSKTFRILRKK